MDLILRIGLYIIIIRFISLNNIERNLLKNSINTLYINIKKYLKPRNKLLNNLIIGT